MKYTNFKQQGFTLIELLAVIVILSLSTRLCLTRLVFMANENQEGI
ncbi:MAG: prepilin-type N-terminal cleavage/methylation domain-containing protein [Bacilli bacterium]